MFFKFILRALKFRKQRLSLAFAALAVAATLATVLFGIYGTVEHRIRDEFSAYGANIVAVPRGGGTVALGLVPAAEKLGAAAAPFLITSGRIGSRIVAIAGFMPDKASSLTSYWHVTGARFVGPGDCLAGESLARELKMKLNDNIGLVGAPCRLQGIIATGGAEDDELLVPFETAANLAGVHDAASLVEIRAPGSTLESVRSSLAASFPEVAVR
ncbi:MAG: ABC transporter permease, partial [Acidobacteriota bacterium]|nr:ABC transporter permease [Acidobacteriota bacterium]